MAVTRYETVNSICNRVAVEFGLDPVADVFGANDSAYTQLTYLLTNVVQELASLYPWQILKRDFQHVTDGSEAGEIALPDDFGYMIPQTGWERSESVPLVGPLNAKEWSYLLGRNLAGVTIYASFRFDQGKLFILPDDPTPSGLSINFEYVSRNLFLLDGGAYAAEATTATDTIQLDQYLVSRWLKREFLAAKGFDTTYAERQAERAFTQLCGQDNSARVLTVGRGAAGAPLLSTMYNTPDTGYGG